MTLGERPHARPLDAPARPIKPQAEPPLLPLATTGARFLSPTSVSPCSSDPEPEERPESLVGTRRNRRHLFSLRFDLVRHEFELTIAISLFSVRLAVANPLGAFPDAAITSNGTTV